MIELYIDKKPDHKLSNNTIIPYRKELHRSLIPALYAEGFSDEPWRNDWDAYEFFDPNGAFLAVSSGQIAGFIISYERHGVGHISVLAVLPRFRSLGIGADLVANAANYLLGKGLKEITINVEPTNIPALHLYKKLGFQPR